MFKKKIVLFDIDYTLFDTAFFKESGLSEYKIYKEVMRVFDSVSKIAKLGIFSKGETQFQKIKLKKTGIMKFFKDYNINIFNDKDANLINVLEKYKNSKIFLVDDKLEVLYSATKHKPQIFTIWIKRGPYAQAQQPIEDFVPSATIDGLSDLYKIVLSN